MLILKRGIHFLDFMFLDTHLCLNPDVFLTANPHRLQSYVMSSLHIKMQHHLSCLTGQHYIISHISSWLNQHSFPGLLLVTSTSLNKRPMQGPQPALMFLWNGSSWDLMISDRFCELVFDTSDIHLVMVKNWC